VRLLDGEGLAAFAAELPACADVVQSALDTFEAAQRIYPDSPAFKAAVPERRRFQVGELVQYGAGTHARVALIADEGRVLVLHLTRLAMLPRAAAVKLTSAVPPSALIVDAGCGAGVETAYFTAAGHRVYAYDASSEMVQAAQPVISDRCPVVYLHAHHELALPACAQAIYAGASLIFLEDEDLALAMQAFYRSLAPGGLVVASFKLGPDSRDAGDGRVFQDKQQEDLTRLAACAGFTPLGSDIDADTLGRLQSWITFWLRKPT